MNITPSIMLVCIAWLAACAPEPGTSVGAETEQSRVEGPDLVRCFTVLGTFDSKDVRCRLVTDAPLGVTEAKLDITTANSGSSAVLTPQEPERVIYSSNVWARVEVGVRARIDASSVAGLSSELLVESKLVVEGERITADSPARVRLPFEVWEVTVIGKDAALAQASLAPYELSLPRLDGSTVAQPVSVALPDVAVGESTKLVIASPSSALKGQGTIGSETRAIELAGSGLYLVRPEGLEHQGGAGGLPEAFACWAERLQSSVELRCQRREAAGLFPLMIDVTVTDKGGASQMLQILFESDKVSVIGDDITDIPGIDNPIPVKPLADAGWPYTIALDVRLVSDSDGVVLAHDGEVVGLGSEAPFSDAPLHASATVGSADELPATAPLVATLPFTLWKVTFRAAPGILFAPESMEPYEVELGTAWNGLEAGKKVTVDGLPPNVSQPDVVEQTFFLPAGPETTAVTGKAIMTGGAAHNVSYTIAGPGIYLAGPNGLEPAAP